MTFKNLNLKKNSKTLLYAPRMNLIDTADEQKKPDTEN